MGVKARANVRARVEARAGAGVKAGSNTVMPAPRDEIATSTSERPGCNRQAFESKSARYLSAGY